MRRERKHPLSTCSHPRTAHRGRGDRRVAGSWPVLLDAAAPVAGIRLDPVGDDSCGRAILGTTYVTGRARRFDDPGAVIGQTECRVPLGNLIPYRPRHRIGVGSGERVTGELFVGA